LAAAGWLRRLRTNERVVDGRYTQPQIAAISPRIVAGLTRLLPCSCGAGHTASRLRRPRSYTRCRNAMRHPASHRGLSQGWSCALRASGRAYRPAGVVWRTRSKPGGALRVPAAIQQQRASPSIEDAPLAPRSAHQVGTCSASLSSELTAIPVNASPMPAIPELLEAWPLIGMGVWGDILVARPPRAPDWQVLPETFKGTICLLVRVSARR
jgi:hypothetical protein